MITIKPIVAILEKKDLNLETYKKLEDNPEYIVNQNDIVDSSICNKFDIVIFEKTILKSRW